MDLAIELALAHGSRVSDWLTCSLGTVTWVAALCKFAEDSELGREQALWRIRLGFKITLTNWRKGLQVIG